MTVSLNQQLEEVRRELAYRRKLYPIWIERGKLKRSHAAYFLERMEAVEHTLVGLMAEKAELKQAEEAEPS